MPQGYRDKKAPRPALKIRSFTASGSRLEAVVALGEQAHTFFFESDDHPLAPAREALLPLTLLVAMHCASSLHVGGGIDPLLLANLPDFQKRLAATDPAFSPVPIEGALPLPAPKGHPSRVGLFFSGGMDSWYSLLDHLDEITDLVFISGADIPLGNPAHLEKAIALVKRVADHFGKNVVTIRTNMRSFTDPYLSWHILLDSLMQSPAHLLGKDFAKIYLSSAHTAANLTRYGLDPTLINLWSSSSLQVVHDSLDVNRVEKTARVAQEQVALNNLRVCWKNPPQGLNCGTCEKCVRTMINLETAGALERCPVFNQPLDLGLISRQVIKEDSVLYNAELNLAAIKARQGNSLLARALRASIRSYLVRRWFHRHFGWMGPRLRRLLKIQVPYYLKPSR